MVNSIDNAKPFSVQALTFWRVMVRLFQRSFSPISHIDTRRELIEERKGFNAGMIKGRAAATICLNNSDASDVRVRLSHSSYW